MDICIDFDGTCVEHQYPFIGGSIGAEPVLKKLVKAGHKLILFTMRSNGPHKMPNGEIDRHGLDDAVEWFKKNDIPLYGIQRNPTQDEWTQSPKAYGQLYIDDAALGCPLIYPKGKKSYVDWIKIERMLIEKGIIK